MPVTCPIAGGAAGNHGRSRADARDMPGQRGTWSATMIAIDSASRVSVSLARDYVPEHTEKHRIAPLAVAKDRAANRAHSG